MDCGQAAPANDEERDVTRGVVLVPTKELCEQVAAHLRQVTKHCEEDVRVANVAQGSAAHLQR
jgi:ATP-dependent RNA helicase DDX56/DBP9